MPLNPLENMPTSLTKHTSVADLNNLNKFRMNGQVKDQRAEEFIKFSPCDNLQNIDSSSLMSPTSYRMFNLSKPEKVSSSLLCYIF